MENPSTKTSPPAVSTAIAEYSSTESALAILREKYSEKKYDVTTTQGMAEAKTARSEVKGYRVALEAERVKIKEPALRTCQLIDSEAKRITAELTKLEGPIDDQIKAEEKRKKDEIEAREQRERERVAAIRQRIDKIKTLPLMVVNYCVAELQEFIEKVVQQPIGIEFAEFTEEATTVKAEVVDTLNNLLAGKQAAEAEQSQLAADREKLQKEQEAFNKEQVRRAKISDIRNIPINAFNYNVKQLEAEISFTQLIDNCNDDDDMQNEIDDAIIKLQRLLEVARIQEATVKQDDLSDNQVRQLAVDQAEERYQAEVLEVKTTGNNELKAPDDVSYQTQVQHYTEHFPSSESSQETVTISKSEYDQLLADSKLLNILRGAGVDNWDGWDYAMEALEAA